jgi:hypothetical protein
MDADNQVSEELLDKLKTEWLKMSDATSATQGFIKDSVTKSIGQLTPASLHMVAYFNKKLDINRFFIEDSEGKTGQGTEMP